MPSLDFSMAIPPWIAQSLFFDSLLPEERVSMHKRLAVVLLIVFSILLAPAANAHAGEADEVLLGFVFGTATGLIFAGAVSIFYTNPKSDKNLETYLIIGGLTGATAGIVFGTLLPDNAVERDPAVSMKEGAEKEVALHMPSVSIAPIRTGESYQWGLQANLIRLDF